MPENKLAQVKLLVNPDLRRMHHFLVLSIAEQIYGRECQLLENLHHLKVVSYVAKEERFIFDIFVEILIEEAFVYFD